MTVGVISKTAVVIMKVVVITAYEEGISGPAADLEDNIVCIAYLLCVLCVGRLCAVFARPTQTTGKRGGA